MHATAQNNETDLYLENLASQFAQQQGMSFGSLKEAQNYLKKIKLRITQLVENGNQKLSNGLTMLAQKNHNTNDYVATVSSTLLKQMGSPKKLRRAIESDVLANENSLTLFLEASDQYIDCGDIEQEQSVLTVLTVLFPGNPQPYIYFGSSIWKNDGIDAAATYYAEAVKILPNPTLYFFAADCFYSNGNIDKARELLHCAREAMQNTPGSYGELTRLVDEALQQCN